MVIHNREMLIYTCIKECRLLISYIHNLRLKLFPHPHPSPFFFHSSHSNMIALHWLNEILCNLFFSNSKEFESHRNGNWWNMLFFKSFSFLFLARNSILFQCFFLYNSIKKLKVISAQFSMWRPHQTTRFSAFLFLFHFHFLNSYPHSILYIVYKRKWLLMEWVWKMSAGEAVWKMPFEYRTKCYKNGWIFVA